MLAPVLVDLFGARPPNEPAKRYLDPAFGTPTGSLQPARASYVPMFAHLALVLGAGIYLPPPLVAWFQHVSGLLG